MHARRIIKIILILLAVFFILLIGIWLLGRNTAKKNGQTPLSFRQFLGLGTSASPANTLPGEGSSTFTGGSTNGTAGQQGNAGIGNNGINTTLAAPQISQFTSSGISPTTANGSGLQGSAGLSGNGLGANSNGTTNSLSAAGISNLAPTCSDADTNIDFTPEEIAKLNELQTQFYAVAQTLHTDADVDTEQANHDAFALKADQDTELYNYCENKVPVITAENSDPRVHLRTATPFWNDPTTDAFSMLDYYSSSGLDANHLEQIHDNNPVDDDAPDTSGIKGPYGALNISDPVSLPINGSIVKPKTVFGVGPNGGAITTTTTDFQLLVPVVEKMLRINLW